MTKRQYKRVGQDGFVEAGLMRRVLETGLKPVSKTL